MTRKVGLLALAAAMLAPAALGDTPDVKETSYRDASGGRVLRESIIVNAVRAKVWAAFTTDAEFMKWGAPLAHITPGNGGLIEFGFTPQTRIGDPNNVRNRIDVFLPAELLVMHNEFVPAGGPMDPKTFGSVRTLLSFADAGAGKTKVTETVVGFGSSKAYDVLYAHLREGNAEYLKSLQDNFGK